MSKPIYEHRVTTGGRKTWDGEPHLDEEGWEEYQEWERFDYHEERYWRRPLTGDALEAELERRARSDRRQTIKYAERAVIEAAKAWHKRMTWVDLDDDRHHYLAEAVEALQELEADDG